MSEPVGSLGEEALRLLRALAVQNSTDAHSSAAVTSGDDPSEETRAEGTHTCSNGWCPICSVVDFVRENPEAIAGVAASASSMLTALRDLIDEATSPKDTSS